MLRKGLQTLAQASSVTPEEIDVKHVRNLLGGMNTSQAPEDIADNEFVLIENMEIRQAKLFRRLGYTQYTTPPNNNLINGLFAIKRYSGLTDILRFTKNSIHKLQSGSWVAITGVALTGGDYDPWTVVTVEDRIFASNGVQNLFELNLTANTYAVAGNARTYKYYCVANRRICGANLVSGTATPIEFGTCGNRNYTEWDPAVDISAYRNPMVDSEPNTSDDITGIVALKDNVIVLREHSVWVGAPQPIASTPFNFRKIVSGVGCTCPPSVQKVGEDQVIWYDITTKAVYSFKLNVNGVDFKEISIKVADDIYNDIQDNRYVSSAYNQAEDEYELVINPPGTNISKVWKYSILYNAWHIHRNNRFNRFWYLFIPVTTGSIESLGSIPISSLSGTIAGLSTTINTKAVKYGTSVDGYIGVETPGIYADLGYLQLPFIKFKVFDYEIKQQNIIAVDLDLDTPGTIGYVVEFFKDKKFTPERSWARFPQTTGPQSFKHNIACDQFWWTLSCTNNIETFTLKGYTLRRTAGGDY